MTTKKNRIEVVFGVRDQDLFEWMVENELNSATAIKNILRTQMILNGKNKSTITIIKTNKDEEIVDQKPVQKNGLAGINYKRM